MVLFCKTLMPEKQMKKQAKTLCLDESVTGKRVQQGVSLTGSLGGLFCQQLALEKVEMLEHFTERIRYAK